MNAGTARWFPLVLLLGCSPEPEPAPGFPARRLDLPIEGRWVAYLTNRHSDSVSVVDLDAMIELWRAPVGRDPVEIDGPRSLVLDRAEERAYVTLSYPFEVTSPHAVDFGGGLRHGFVQQLNALDLSILGELRVDERALDVALAPEGGVLAVSHYDEVKASTLGDVEQRRANIALIAGDSWLDLSATILPRVPTCVAPSGLVFGADRSRVFVACTGEDSLVVLDTDTRTVIARVPAGDQVVNKPFAVAADAARERLLVVNQVSRRVSVFGMTDSPELRATLVLEGIPRAASWASPSEILVLSEEPARITRFDAATGIDVEGAAIPPDECQGPNDVRQLEDGRVFLVCAGNGFNPGSVVELAPSSFEITRSVAVGTFPDRLVVREP